MHGLHVVCCFVENFGGYLAVGDVLRFRVATCLITHTVMHTQSIFCSSTQRLHQHASQPVTPFHAINFTHNECHRSVFSVCARRLSSGHTVFTCLCQVMPPMRLHAYVHDKFLLPRFTQMMTMAHALSACWSSSTTHTTTTYVSVWQYECVHFSSIAITSCIE